MLEIMGGSGGQILVLSVLYNVEYSHSKLPRQGGSRILTGSKIASPLPLVQYTNLHNTNVSIALIVNVQKVCFVNMKLPEYLLERPVLMQRLLSVSLHTGKLTCTQTTLMIT